MTWWQGVLAYLAASVLTAAALCRAAHVLKHRRTR